MFSLGFAFLRLWKGFRSGFHEPMFRALLLLLAIMIASATVFYRTVEDWLWIDCVYFAVMTLTTNMPHDFVVTSAVTKLFTIVYVFTGTGVMITFALTLGNHIVGIAKAAKAESKD